MKTLRGTYVHRGDGQRRRNRIKQVVLAVSFFSAVGFVLGNRAPAAPDAEAALVTSHSPFRIDLSTDRSLATQLDSARGELELARTQLARATRIIGYSSRYGIDAHPDHRERWNQAAIHMGDLFQCASLCAQQPDRKGKNKNG